MRELGDDVTDRQTDTRTQPFIVKDKEFTRAFKEIVCDARMYQVYQSLFKIYSLGKSTIFWNN